MIDFGWCRSTVVSAVYPPPEDFVFVHRFSVMNLDFRVLTQLFRTM
ncbi:hypothetical protein EUTSA_v10019752mg [Eutrema salsugineum]|uniref:Uncharacterized protein n=1 Tax=Eutrema salsugineum TaxID=72664 RepID=V4JQV8_EUTSA|nr:hypothetical protein EUTSA_v10019752mg [Eutrema salsugineum]